MNESNLHNFCLIWQDEFDEELSIGEAEVIASKLLELYRTLEQPFPASNTFYRLNSDPRTIDRHAR